MEVKKLNEQQEHAIRTLSLSLTDMVKLTSELLCGDTVEKVHFARNVFLNLLGNFVIETTNDENGLDGYTDNARLTVQSAEMWFKHALQHLKNLKEAH